MARHTSASDSVEASDRPADLVEPPDPVQQRARVDVQGPGRPVGLPGYDHAEMTTVAAARVGFELLALMLLGRT